MALRIAQLNRKQFLNPGRIRLIKNAGLGKVGSNKLSRRFYSDRNAEDRKRLEITNFPKHNLMTTMFIPTKKIDSNAKGLVNEPTATGDLLVKAGYITQSSSGVYTLLTLGNRVVDKLINIIDEELQKIGGQKINMPTLLPVDPWEKTGRKEKMGNELFKLNDRKGTEFILGPTCEEEVTRIFANEIMSYRKVPLLIYQITRKFRDEMRPRSELLRCKEFLMKDMYSFDSNENDALESYKRVREAYNNIFKRIGADFAVADADSGDIGGSLSQEYHILSKDGEDTLIKCNSCSAVSNEEKAVGVVPQNIRVDSKSAITKNMENGSFNLSLSVHGFKYSINGEKIINLFLLPVGRQPNTVKCNKAITKNSNTSNNVTGDSSGNRQAELGILEFSFVDGVEIEKLREIVGDTSSTEIFIDKQTLLDPENAQALAKNLSMHLNLVVNQKNNRGKDDANGVYTGDYTEIKQGDFCEPCFNGVNHKNTGVENRPKLVAQRAIEVGHIFYLGTKYSIPLGANLTNKVNKLVPAEMGCYGIGVMRTVQAVADWSRFNSSAGSVEAGNVNNRLVWPVSISPYSVCIIPFEVNKKRLDLPFDTYEQLVNSGVQRITGELSALKSRRGHKFTSGNTHAHNNDGEYDCSYGNSGSLFSPENLVVDDRLYLSNGYRLTDSEIIGFPFVIVLGNDYFNSGHQNIELRVNTLKNKTVSQYNEHESAIPSSTTPDGTIVFKNLPINRIGETITKFL